MEEHPEPAWIVATAGTGGTSATLARYVRYTGRDTGICVADPENSAFFPGWRDHDPSVTTAIGSRIEGIGRQRMESSFIAASIDRMMRVPDAAAIASVRLLESLICDPGERYLDKYYSQEWLADNDIDIKPYEQRLAELMETGRLR